MSRKLGIDRQTYVVCALGFGLMTYGILATAGIVAHLVEVFQGRIGLPTFAQSPYYLAHFWWQTIGRFFAIAVGLLMMRRPVLVSRWLGIYILVCVGEAFTAMLMFGIPGLGDLRLLLSTMSVPLALTAVFLRLRRADQLGRLEIGALSCMQCGYSLRGLSEPRCPECGRVYTLDEFYRL